MTTLVATMAAALATAALFEALRVPAGALIGAMVAVAALRLGGLGVGELPDAARFAGFAAIGWLIGQGVTRDVVATLWAAVVPVTASVAAIIVFGALVGWTLVRTGVLDPATAYLATSPGALTQMAAIGLDVGANTPIVVTVHVLRLVTLMLLAPVVVRWLPPGS